MSVFGRNTFGQEGDHHCSGSSPNASPGCRGQLICALDPYGCSCVAGFHGRDCMTGKCSEALSLVAFYQGLELKFCI